MKISQIAAAVLVPATVAGVVLTAVPFAEAAPASTAHHAAKHAVHHGAPAGPVKLAKPRPQGQRHVATKHAAAKQAASSTAQTPAQNVQAGSGQASAQSQSATVGQPLTAGMSSFEQCVAWRE